MRTNVGEVKKIISTSASNDTIEEMIRTANLMVTTNLTGEGLSVDTLMQIEKWLAAHLLSITYDRQPIRSEIGGDTSEQYPKLGEGLKMTTYGQMALALDTTGNLATAGTGMKKIKIEAVTSFDEE